MLRPRIGLLLLTVFASGLVSSCGRSQTMNAPDPASAVAWVEMTGQGAEARISSPDGRCPDAVIDGQAQPMSLRAPASADFPAICAIRPPRGATHLSIGDRMLPLPHDAPNRIVIIGDTGCRIQGLDAQSCNDPQSWPFPAVAAQAAREAPDLVIHVGDYYYRENACPLTGRCGGSPFGDHWPTWRAEFFDPAAPLLARAPMVFVRGNHEECRRGGTGWFRLLEAGPWRPVCGGLSDPFVVQLGSLILGVVDSSDAQDRAVPHEALSDMAHQFERLDAKLEARDAFLLTHRPIWAMVPAARLGPAGLISVAVNRTQQAAARDHISDGVKMIISGHIHHFAAYDFGPQRPAQLVAGEGGDEPLPADRPRFDHTAAVIDGMPARRLSFARYGYVLMIRSGTDWRIEAHEVDGSIAAACRLSGRRLTCDTLGRP